jgi:hypothetical protein
MAKKINPFDDMLNKSIKELKANSKAVEMAIEGLLKQEGIDVSEKEFKEIKQLTDTMNELDSVLYKMQEAPVKKNKPKAKPKRKAKRRK